VTIALGVAVAGLAWWMFGSVDRSDWFLGVSLSVIGAAMGVRAWQSRREPRRFEVENRVGMARFHFADPAASRRFAAVNSA
jgi:hypothetical protein